MPIISTQHGVVGEDGILSIETTNQWFPPPGPFAAAYSDDGSGGEAFDAPKARDIYRDLVRARRDLSAADIAVNKAADAGDTKAEKAARATRQALRDLTNDPEIDKADSVEDLRAIWPLALLGAAPF